MTQKENQSRLLTSKQIKKRGDGTTDRKTMKYIILLLLLLAICLQPEKSLQTNEKNKVTINKNAASSSSSTTVHHSGLPKVDEIYFKAYPGAPPEVAVDDFLEGQTDWIEGPSRSDLYQLVVDAGQKVSEMCPEAEFHFFPINCRDYKFTNGNPNAPLNDSNWRLALSYVYGVDDKQADIFSYYGVPWHYALGNPVPPAQEPWYDNTTVMPNTDNETAWSILSSAGYTVQDYDGQPWLHRNGVPVRPPDGPNSGKIILLYSTSCGVCVDGPLGGMADNWNAFIQDYLNANGPLMQVTPTDFSGMISDLLTFRNFDVIAISLTNLGRYVDWIYDCFHSDNDVPWGWNFPGIHDDDFDRWSEIIMTSLDEEEVIEATENFTRKFVYELMPWMPAITRSEFCTTARDDRGELTNIIPMDNYGPMNDWSYMTVHWKGEPDVAWPGGTVTVALGDDPYTLNPLRAEGYSYEILDRSVVGLTIVEPENLMNMPFVATDWENAYWTSIPELGIVNGCRCTFWLRQDVTWHDGRPVTAYDCVENLRFWREVHPPFRSDPWGLVYEEADGPHKFNVYFSLPRLDRADFVARKALLVPKHIARALHIFDKVEWNWQTWEPSDNDYEDLGLGPPPPEYPFLKQLVGCGPFVFDYYDRDQAIGRVERYQDFFVNAPVIGSVVGEWRINPLDSYTYKPLVQNMAAVEADENGTFTDVTVDVKMYEDNILVHEVDGLNLDLWNWTYLGPYTIESAACGLHNITVEVYDHTNQTLLHNYNHVFAVTIEEDLTTCSGESIDFEVDMRDIGKAASAFGSYPDHARWDPICDINKDYEVDMRDLGRIARKFGWHC